MIKLDLSARPMVWHTVSIPLDGDPAELRVRYRILRKAEVDARSAERIELARLVRGGDEVGALDAILERLSEEQREAMRAALRDAIAEWDLQDLQGAPIPVSPEAVTALLEYGIYLLPLYDGLIEASNGAARKNA
jgi:hypothetical protein